MMLENEKNARMMILVMRSNSKTIKRLHFQPLLAGRRTSKG